MINIGEEPRSTTNAQDPSVTAEKALKFISKGWREVKHSADADFQLMRARANSFRNLANSFDRELENFVNTASTFSVPAIRSSPSSEIDFVKRLQPKISEFRRNYSSPDFSRKVLEKWSPKSSIRINLSAIKDAIVSEVEDREGIVEVGDWESFRRRGRKVGLKQFRWDWGAEVEEDEGSKEWEPIKAFKSRLRELERKSSSSEIFESFKNNEFVEKFKSSLKSIYKEPQDSNEVPPLDASELLAYLVKQSGPLFDQLGFKRDICDKIVETFCSKHKNQLLLRSLQGSGESSFLETEHANDELDVRIASVIRSTGHTYEGGLWNEPIKPKSEDGKRNVAIVTTASLPWMTGTAVNPLFRAAYLAKAAKQNVTLVVPWLCKSDQELVYPNSLTFSSPEEQEVYIRNWLEERLNFKADFKISFYPGKFSKERRSIIPSGDTTQFISSKEADIAILEEPEHLNWYHHGKRWTDKFNHVVGIVHTNYLEYIKREKNGALQAFLVEHVNTWVARAQCDKILRLSGATQDLPRSVVCNVHGVNPKFLEVGEKVAHGEKEFSRGAYFLGKMVWAKGYRELIDLLAKHKSDLDGFNLDVFGNGEDAQEVQTSAKKLDLNVNFLKGRDHADDLIHGYKVFINPSVSDVLCTATAEALAMGKFVVCAEHPSNEFFRAFPNCLTYKSSEDFVDKVKQALENEPKPLTDEQRYNLSWEAATQRFMEYSDLEKFLEKAEEPRRMKKSVSLPTLTGMVDGSLAFAQYCLSGNEIFRLSTGATPGTLQYTKEQSEDLNLLPPHVENPIYGL